MTSQNYLIEMARRTRPSGCLIVDKSTPVVAFGDVTTSRVATLGINPSDREFVENGKLLDRNNRRLETLDSLKANDSEVLTTEQAQSLLAGCYDYFKTGKAYGNWFDILDQVINSGLGVSYYDGSACHLDLVQWATSTKWASLPKSIRIRLLDEGTQHLRDQLTNEQISHVIVNGRAVWNELTRSKFLTYDEVGCLTYGSQQTKSKLIVGNAGSTKFIGWTANLQSGFGAKDKEFREKLIEWLKEHAK